MENHDVLDLTRRLGREPNVDTALDIITWELGDLTKSWVYSKWHPTDAGVYREEAKLALASLLFQSLVVARLLGTDFQKLIDIGVETVQDRIKEKEEKIGRFERYEGEPLK